MWGILYILFFFSEEFKYFLVSRKKLSSDGIGICAGETLLGDLGYCDTFTRRSHMRGDFYQMAEHN